MYGIGALMFVVMLAAGCSGDSEPASPSSSSTEEASSVAAPRADEPDDRPVILAFGDSLTEGSGLPPGSGYPEMLQKELDRLGRKYRVVNAGVGGDTTANGLARIGSALRLQPEIVILELGANDGLRGLPADSIRANLDEMIAVFKANGAKVLLAGMTLPRNFGMEYIESFERIFPELAAKHEVALIPFFLDGVGGIPHLNLEDGIHPNVEGYRIVTANVLKHIDPLLGE